MVQSVRLNSYSLNGETLALLENSLQLFRANIKSANRVKDYVFKIKYLIKKS